MLSKADIERYFNAEKAESYIFVGFGIIAILIAIFFLIWHRNAFSVGLAIPLVLVAFIQITVGYTVLKRSDQQRIDNVYALDMNPNQLRIEELPRMKTVMRNFIIYRWVEIGLMISGIALYFLFRENPERVFWVGVGMGLSIQSAAMLIADYFAERRGQEYFDGLKSLLEM